MMRGDVVRSGLDVYKKARWNFLQLQGRLDSNSRGGLSVELKSISRNGKIHYEECETINLRTGRCSKFYLKRPNSWCIDMYR